MAAIVSVLCAPAPVAPAPTPAGKPPPSAAPSLRAKLLENSRPLWDPSLANSRVDGNGTGSRDLSSVLYSAVPSGARLIYACSASTPPPPPSPNLTPAPRSNFLSRSRLLSRSDFSKPSPLSFLPSLAILLRMDFSLSRPLLEIFLNAGSLDAIT